MKINLTLEDSEDGRPHFNWDADGHDPQKRSMAYSVAVLLRMVVELLNSTVRPDLVSFIATLHAAHRSGQLGGTEVTYVPADSGHRH